MGWVLAGIAALCVFIGFSRVRLLVSYEGAFRFEVGVWIFRLRLPGQPGPKKTKPQKAKPSKKRAVSKPDSSFFLEHLSELFDLTKKLVSATGRRLVVDRLYINLRIHEDDAASTAIRYGQACALVYTAAGFLEGALRVRKHDIRVTPLFEEGEASAAFSAAFSIRVFSILALAVTQGASIIKMMLSFLHSAKDTTATIQKDGAVS